MPIEEVTRKEKHFNRLFPGEKIIKRLFTLKKTTGYPVFSMVRGLYVELAGEIPS